MNRLAQLGDAVFRWVGQTTWQAAVLAIMILLAQGLMRKRLSPGWRYGLWLLLVARLLMPAIPPSAFSIFNLAPPAPKHPNGAHQVSIGTDPYFVVNSLNGTPQVPPTEPEWHVPEVPSGVSVRPVPVWKIEWSNVLFWGWLAGVCFFGARLLWTNARFRSRIVGYQPIADEDVKRLFDDCRAAFKITHSVRVIESEEVESPAVYGLRRKWLLLPDGIFERFSTEELRCIFLHELAHIKRGDLGVNWLVALLQVLHWFNPVLWLAWARMRADREVATDALALSHVRQADHVPYGETILKVLAGLTGARALPGSVGIVESKAQLKECLIAISRPGKTWKWAAVAAFVLIAGLGLTRAQTEKTSRDQDELSGTVVMPDGKPAAGATVGLFYDYNQTVFELDSRLGLRGRAVPCETDAHGHFALEPVSGIKWLAAEVSNGFAVMSVESFLTNRMIRLKPFDLAAARRARDLEITQQLIRAAESRRISGKVVDPSGHPIAGAQVALAWISTERN
ncbi:MAG: M56 family metallopeptidase [Limisphaerales bacterium]